MPLCATLIGNQWIYIYIYVKCCLFWYYTKNVRTYLLHCLKQPSGNDTKAILTALLVVPSIWYSHGVRWWIQVSHIFTSFISSLSFQWAQKTTLNCSPLLHFALTSCEVGESSYYSKYLEASYVIFPVFFPDFFFHSEGSCVPFGKCLWLLSRLLLWIQKVPGSFLFISNEKGLRCWDLHLPKNLVICFCSLN